MFFQKLSPRSFAALLLLVVATSFFAGCEPERIQSEPSQLEVNPNFVPINWDATQIVSSNDSTGDYQLRFSGTVPQIRPGSIIAIDRDTVVLYRLILSSVVNGSTMSVTSTKAYLTDIFSNTEFSLSTITGGKSRDHGIVIYPSEAYISDGNGGYHTLDLSHLRKGDTPFTQGLWNGQSYSLDGEVIASDYNWNITLEKMCSSLGIDMEVLLTFSGRTERELIDNSIEHYRSRVMEVKTELTGRFETEQQIRFHNQGGNISYSPDCGLWKHNLFRPASIKFMAGPVPIALTLKSDLYRQVDFHASGEISASTGCTQIAEGRFGFAWNQANGISPVTSIENSFAFSTPSIEGRGQLQAKVFAYPRVTVMVNDAVGSSFDFMPYLSDTLQGGYHEQSLGQSNNYCAWTLDCHAGLDLQCGLNLRSLDHNGEDLSSSRWNHVNRKLYHSPKRISHQSGRPEAGQTRQMSFVVYDQNLISNQEVPTPLHQIVKFETNGQLSSQYGIANNGSVSVNWTPSSDSDILFAKLIDVNGTVLAQDTVHAAENSDWVDLGLPSGILWATRNVGATSPEDYGDYFAWGEITPKDVYDWTTYRYCNGNDSTFTKYCYTPYHGYNGFSDTLTILQPGDDAATANYGGRTPTEDEWWELIDNTTILWTWQNGVRGCRFTASNGNSLFLPAAGVCYNLSNDQVGKRCNYWCCSLKPGYFKTALRAVFSSSLQTVGYDYRYAGHSVRAVSYSR